MNSYFTRPRDGREDATLLYYGDELIASFVGSDHVNDAALACEKFNEILDAPLPYQLSEAI